MQGKDKTHSDNSAYRFANDLCVLREVRAKSLTLLIATPFSPLTFDLSLDNILENASIVKQPLRNEAYGVHRPRFEPINYVEILRSVYSLWNLPVTITYTAKYKKFYISVHAIEKEDTVSFRQVMNYIVKCICCNIYNLNCMLIHFEALIKKLEEAIQTWGL